ncbi:MAG: hydantoinase/oxoprolinase N-terminal domain-containing protein [Eubacteriaceae bacterium]
MKIGVGIDTGGTYTDAVVYDFEKKKILCSAKDLTTKDDLSIGISNALDRLQEGMLQKAEIVCLSTTLATNACVEEKGGRGKLIFIGGDKDVVSRTGKVYGLPELGEIYFLDGKINYTGEIEKEPNWDDFLLDCKDWMKDADAIAVVQQLGIRNSETERRAKELIIKEYGKKTICGYELFNDLNYVKRGASTLLNARLIPVIDDFLKAIKISLDKRNINAPVVIVRSDGSLMSEKFTTVRPVETLLCGPAASVMGGVELTKEKNCMIIDMGGTTTDMAIVKEGLPVKTKDGVKVGKWQTFVKSVYIDTFGLGGDSRISTNKKGSLILETSRVIPLSIATDKCPNMLKKLKKLVWKGDISKEHTHEFFSLVKDISNNGNYSVEERNFCKALKDGPLIYSECVDIINKRVYSMFFDRLEEEGIIIRCGLTPTDLMHVKGDFNKFNSEAANLGAEYVSLCMGVTKEKLCDMVYDKVKETLYYNIVRMLLEDKYNAYKKNGIDDDLKKMICEGWSVSNNDVSGGFLKLNFNIPATLVGVGAPIHIFLPDVAKALNTKYIIPDNASVANALGAVVGNISVTCDIDVKPHISKGYVVFGKTDNRHVDTIEDAIEIAKEEAKFSAKEEAIRRGASGDITVSVFEDLDTPKDLFMSRKVSATAIGRFNL